MNTTRPAQAARRCSSFVPGILALGTAASLAAQTAPPTTPIQLEAVTVTGSNIRRADIETALPVTVLDLEDFDLRGASTPADLFDTITIANPPLLTEQESAGQSARGDNTSIDLRGLGSGSTLVLVNGRRMPPHPISQSEFGTPALSVNVNTVPSGLTSRVEILRDGASAIYGSEAAAGVVNYIVAPRFDGLFTSVRGSFTDDGGAGEMRYTVRWGNNKLNGGKTRISFGADFLSRDALMASERWYAANSDLRRTTALPAPWNGQPFTLPGATALTRDNDFNNSSNISRFGFYTRGVAQPDGSINGSRPDGNRGISTSTSTTAQTPTAAMSTAGVFYFVPLADGTVGFHPSSTVPVASIDSHLSGYYENVNDGAYILPRTERFQFGMSFDHKISNKLTFFSDVFLYRANSVAGRVGVQIDAADTRNLSMGVDNPFNPFGSRFYHPTGAPNADGTSRFLGAPSPVVIGAVRPLDHKKRNIYVHSYSFRATAGLRGKLGNRWEWESGLLYGGAHTKDMENYSIRESRLAEALQSSNPATAYNPFGYTFRVNPTTNLIVIDQPYSNPDSVMKPMIGEYERSAWTGLGILDYKMNGPIFELFGNDVSAAIGVEGRYESYKFRMPPYAGPAPASDTNPYIRPGDNDYILASPNENADLDRKVYSTFTELLFPFITRRNNIAYARLLELSLAARLERFPGFGNATKPKASLGYIPVRWLKLRASVNESFKAPNILQTNPARRQVFSTGISDPYRFEVTNIFTDGSTGRTVFRSGSADLLPEESVNYTAGFVLDVPFVKGLSFTVDFWKANQNNLITSSGGDDQLLTDEQMLDDETRRQLAAGVPIANVDLGSGTANYKGNPLIKRAPVTAADRALYNTFNNNANNFNNRRGVVGPVIDINEEFVNLAGRDLEGIDFGVEYTTPRSATWGTFAAQVEGSFRAKFMLQETVGAAPGDDLWEDGRAIWRWNTTLRWRKDNWSVGWFTSYYGSFVDSSASTTAAVFNYLGRPKYIDDSTTSNAGVTRYLLRVKPSIAHNINFGYRFDRNAHIVLRNSSVRWGVNNILNTEPPIADATYGYQSGTYNPRGRQFWMELSRTW